MSIACDMEVTAAKAADAAELAFLINSAYRAQSGASGWTNEAGMLAGPRADEALLRTLVTESEATILCLRRRADPRLLGCVSVQPGRGASWHLSLLATDPRLQNLGLGRILLDEAERFAHSSGGQTAGMTVIHLRETLIKWYERRGYRRTGEMKAFPYDDPSVGTPLRNDLQLVVLEKSLAYLRNASGDILDAPAQDRN